MTIKPLTLEDLEQTIKQVRELESKITKIVVVKDEEHRQKLFRSLRNSTRPIEFFDGITIAIPSELTPQEVVSPSTKFLVIKGGV